MKQKPQQRKGGFHVRGNFIDRVVCAVAPSAGVKRLRARASLTAAENTGFVTFGSGKRSMQGAFASYGSADSDTLPKLNDMRASSRDLSMNSPVACAALNRAKTNIVGYGLTLQARIDRKFLKLTDEKADEWEANTEREFQLWAKSKNCDASRTQNFYELQAMTLLSELTSGDVFALKQYKPAPGSLYGFCLKIIESDQVNTPITYMADEKYHGGIQVDADGAPVNYFVQKTHPGSSLPSLEWSTIPAYSKSGRRNILHLYEKIRPGQRRGVPMLAPVIEPLKQITRLSAAELQAAVITSFFTVFIKNPSGADFLTDGIGESEKLTNDDRIVTERGEDKNGGTVEMGSGTAIELADGQEPIMADPKRPNALYSPFFTALVDQIGAAVNQPGELIMLKFTASYSASRAAFLQAWKWIMSRRTALKWEFCEPSYEEFLAEAVDKGRIVAPGFFSDPATRAAWCGSEWTGPGMGQINPEVETKASIEKIKNNLSTHTKEVAAVDGDDWERMMPLRIREQKFLKENDMLPVDKTASAPQEPHENDAEPPSKKQDQPDTENEEDVND
jgi:lambda family phage portal protein